ETDVDMVQDADNEHLWVIDEVDLVDGEAKFRAEDDWAVNWGLDVWPAGIGVQDGPNIPITGGTYRISINTLTGDFGFVDPATVSTQEVLDPAAIKVFPNPTNAMLNINLTALEFSGEIQVTIMDLTGRVQQVHRLNKSDLQAIDVSGLASGNYFLQIANDNFLIGKRFSVAK
ncbi:MAG: T9SS type A sorting domain-containing protein, partial [Bacteroidota bacterium]